MLEDKLFFFGSFEENFRKRVNGLQKKFPKYEQRLAMTRSMTYRGTTSVEIHALRFNNGESARETEFVTSSFIKSVKARDLSMYLTQSLLFFLNFRLDKA
jgi:hypothetical protein